MGRLLPLPAGPTVSLCSSLSHPPDFAFLRAVGGGRSQAAWFKCKSCHLQVGCAGGKLMDLSVSFPPPSNRDTSRTYTMGLGLRRTWVLREETVSLFPSRESCLALGVAKG